MLRELSFVLLLGAATCTASTARGFMTISEMQARPEVVTTQLEQEYRSYRNTGERSALLQHLLNTLRFPAYYQEDELAKKDDSRSILNCLLCDAAAATVINYRRFDNSTTEFMRTVLEDFCVWFNIQSSAVCVGAVEAHLDLLLYIIDHTPNLGVSTVCGLYLQSEGCGLFANPDLEWTIEIDSNKPKPSQHIDLPGYVEEDPLHFVHIGDVHLDPKYLVGGNAHCDEPTCCRASQGPPSSPENAAGKWADYNHCDVPRHTLEDMVSNIRNQHDKIDVIYFTGDIIDHVVWETSIEQNTKTIKEVLALYKATFGDVPVFVSLGNHETHPLNTYAPKEIQGELSTRWLYDLVADEWGKWLPESTKETIRTGGYYTVLVRPGFRVISLNNVHCYVQNWWLMHKPSFPAEQLNWLAKILLEAEKANEKVHILNHLPPGDHNCFVTWAREYHRIVDRFSHVIKAQFNGHSHKDEFEIFYDHDNSSLASAVSWNGGAVTPYPHINPNYKVYQVHPDNYNVLDFESWSFNVTEANLQPDVNPTWYKLYSFKDTYGVPDLTPKSLDLLAQNLAKNPDLLRRYWALKGKTGDAWLSDGCDQTCLNGHLCQILTSNYADQSKCDQYIKG